MMKKLTVLTLTGLLAWFLTGCQSDQYYRSRAADDAREFLLENSPELTADQVCFVRYNDPVVLVGDGVGNPEDIGGRETSSSYIRQICLAWDIPGRNEIYLVCGFSRERMQFWSPNRLIRKKFERDPQVQDKMLASARGYLLNNLAEGLTTEEINRVRFTYPTLAESDFEINFKTDLSKGDDAVAKLKEAAAKQKQYSLIWEIGDRRAVFTGYAGTNLAGWSIQFAGILPAAEVAQHTRFVVKTPGNFNTELIPEIK